MKAGHSAVQLEPSLLETARRTAKEEGIALDQFVGDAVSEKLASIQNARALIERVARADRDRAMDVLRRAGTGNSPDPGDDIIETASVKLPSP